MRIAYTVYAGSLDDPALALSEPPRELADPHAVATRPVSAASARGPS